MLKKNVLFITLILTIFNNINASNPIDGKYCANIFGSTIDISISETYANLTGNIFGNLISCPWQKYKYNNTNILLSQNKSSCINTNLKKNDACPCPPDMTYTNGDLVAHNTPLGNLIFKEC